MGEIEDAAAMSEIVNLKRARKTKARLEAEGTAAANRARHGTAKAVRALTKARSEQSAALLDSHRLERGKDLKD
ncbi:MAG TPA: DUF4169 family protein [Micropepsaceae bacterium]